jgi:hypothetical protein
MGITRAVGEGFKSARSVSEAPHGAMQKGEEGETLGLPGRSPIPVLL